MKNDCIRTCLPICKGMLKILLTQVQIHYDKINQPYLKILYQTMLSTMYYGLLRISEVAGGKHQHPVKAADVHVGVNKKKFLLILRTSKTHGRNMKPQRVKISASADSSLNHHLMPTTSTRTVRNHCPYSLLREYSDYRGGFCNPEEPFFVFADKSPVQPNHLRSCLKQLLKEQGLKVHCFRAIHSELEELVNFSS